MKKMELELVSENSLAKIEYDRENKVLIATCAGIFDLDLALDGFETVLKTLPEYPLRGLIFDCMDMSGTYTKMNPWLNKIWYPALIPQGYICWSLATVDVFTRFASNMLINTLTPKEITAKVFGSYDKAEAWTYNFLKERPE